MTAFAFNAVRLNGTLLGGIDAPNFDRRENQMARGDDGQVHQTTAAVIRIAPMASFSTVAARALAVILGTGDEVPHVALDGTNGLELLGLKINDAGPGYASGIVHARRQGARGALYLSGLSWSPGDVLRASAEAFFLGASGTADPVASSLTTAPTLPLNTEQMGLETLTLGGTTLTRVRSLDISIDHRAANDIEDICYNLGLPHPLLLATAGINGPAEVTATVETLDLDTVIAGSGTLVAGFKSLNHLGVGLGSNALTVTLNAAIIREVSIPGQAGGAGVRRFEIRATFNGTNKPLTIVTS